MLEEPGQINVFAVKGFVHCEDVVVLDLQRSHLEILRCWLEEQTFTMMINLTAVVVAADPKEPPAAVAPLRPDHLLLGALLEQQVQAELPAAVVPPLVDYQLLVALPDNKNLCH